MIPSWEVDGALILISMAEKFSFLQLIMWEAGVILVIRMSSAAEFSELCHYKMRKLLR